MVKFSDQKYSKCILSYALVVTPAVDSMVLEREKTSPLSCSYFERSSMCGNFGDDKKITSFSQNLSGKPKKKKERKKKEALNFYHRYIVVFCE